MRTGGNLENLTVLDYFAAKAMAAMLVSDQYKTESEGDIAQLAYAYRTPDDERPGIGTAAELIEGKTPYTRGSELQNLETSAWGRCLAALGLGLSKGIASKQEVQAAKDRQAPGPAKPKTPDHGMGKMLGPNADTLRASPDFHDRHEPSLRMARRWTLVLRASNVVPNRSQPLDATTS